MNNRLVSDMESKTFFDNFETIANAPGGIARLRSLVLSLAMSGQLVQRDSDWVEERLGECVVLRNGRAYSQTELLDTGTPVIRIQNLNGGKNWYYSNLDLPPEKLCEDGDLLFAWSASFGPYIWSGPTAIFHYHIWKIEVGPQLHKEFLFYLLQHLTEEIKKSSHGLAMLHMTKKKMENLVVGFPSVSEQLRVVDKVREIFLLCEELEAAQNRRNSIRSAARKSATDAISTATTPEELEAAWKRVNSNWNVIADSVESVNALRELILDVSVRGDLGIENITTKFASIEWDIDELKLDADKLWQLETLHTNPTKGWSRLPLARLGTWGSGGTPTASRKEFYDNGTIPWAVIGDLNNGIMTETAVKITEKALSSSAAKLIPKDAVLIAMYGASIGKTAVSGIECATNQAIAHCIVDGSVISTEYFFLVAKSLKKHLIKAGKGAAQPNISQSVLKHLLIDVPDLKAQQVVVSKVGQLMELCDQLEDGLKDRGDLAEKFARSVVNVS